MTPNDADNTPGEQQATAAGRISSTPLWIAAVATAGLGIAMVTPAVKTVFYNASVSVPRGWYARVPLPDVTPGQLVLVDLPAAAASMAAERGYLAIGVPALKRIAARSGDEVCERSGAVRINGRLVAVALARDRAGRPLRAWQGCRTLQSGEIFLLNTSQPASFDSRYFGPIRRESILGKAVPLWTEKGR